MTQDYIKLTNTGDDIARIADQVLSGYLERIDELDKSNDFSNLLHDMNRSEWLWDMSMREKTSEK